MIAILQSVESYADMDSTITTFGNSITEQPLMVALERMKEIQVKCKASLRPDTSGVSEGVVLTRLSRLFAPMLPAMSSTSCVDILNSFATLNHNPGIDGPGLLELYAHIRNHKLKALQSEPVTVLVQLAWSMGRICRHGERPVDEELFAQLAGQIFPRINKLSINPQPPGTRHRQASTATQAPPTKAPPHQQQATAHRGTATRHRKPRHRQPAPPRHSNPGTDTQAPQPMHRQPGTATHSHPGHADPTSSHAHHATANQAPPTQATPTRQANHARQTPARNRHRTRHLQPRQRQPQDRTQATAKPRHRPRRNQAPATHQQATPPAPPSQAPHPGTATQATQPGTANPGTPNPERTMAHGNQAPTQDRPPGSAPGTAKPRHRTHGTRHHQKATAHKHPPIPQQHPTQARQPRHANPGTANQHAPRQANSARTQAPTTQQRTRHPKTAPTPGNAKTRHRTRHRQPGTRSQQKATQPRHRPPSTAHSGHRPPHRQPRHRPPGTANPFTSNQARQPGNDPTRNRTTGTAPRNQPTHSTTDPGTVPTQAPPNHVTVPPRELSMLAQAYADAGMYNWPLLDAVSSSAKKKLHDFDPAAAINIASSFARLKFNVQIMRGHMNILKGAQLAKLCKAFGSLKYSNEEFFQSASIALQRRMCDLNCEQRSSAALTVFLQQDPFVAQALASPPPPVPSPPNPHSMGGLAPPPSHLPPKTLDQAIAVLTRAERGVSSSSLLSVKNTANMLWGYARVGFCDEALLKVVATRMKVLLKDVDAS
eukprot:gene16688-22950_t